MMRNPMSEIGQGYKSCSKGEVLAELCSRQECNCCVDWRINMKKFPKLKMEKTELQEYLIFKHRGKKVEAKKGKGSRYNRSKVKASSNFE